MIKIGFIGAASTGKTTLARLVSAYAPLCIPELKCADLVQEYARSYIKRYNFNDIAEQILLFDKQLEEEEAVHPSSSLLVTDSPLHLTYCYALDLCQKDPSRRNQKLLSEVQKRVIKVNMPPRYDIMYHLKAGVIPQVDDGVRAPIHLDPVWSQSFDGIIQATIRMAPAKLTCAITVANVDDRIDLVLESLQTYIHEYNSIHPDHCPKPD